LVEDCAIALDSSLDGKKVGNFGDAAIFSTDHSKPINTIIGGMLYTKSSDLHERMATVCIDLPQLSNRHQLNLFSQLKFEKKHFTPGNYPRARMYGYIRSIYRKVCGAGPVFMEGNYNRPDKKEQYPYPAALPPFLAALGIFELERWPIECKLRRALLASLISKFYDAGLGKYLPKIYNDPRRNIVPLRLIVMFGDLDHPLMKLSKFIDVGGTWFRSPVIGTSGDLQSIN